MIYRSVASLLLCLTTISLASSSAPAGLLFYETFDEADPFESGKWTKSSDEKYVDQSISITPAKQPVKGFENDKGLQLSKEMKHYGISAKFPEPLSFQGQKELVIQYELKLEDTLACGGAYVKLPRLTDGLDLRRLNSATPYTIMFGPDKCGSTNNKVHFILQHQNPLTKEWEEKHFNDTPTVKMDKKYHLYTLSLKDDNSFEIFVDKKMSKKGNLLTHMKPSINPPKEIDDPEDKKPEDWVEEAKIDDPNSKKPDDWDESAIPDPKAVKPADWLEDAPLKIPDPSATKPEDWDDEEDGEWEAPVINNPDCKPAGCGPWSAPLVKNPAYKGKWKVPKIDNPAYKGPWKARKIPNTQIFEDSTPMIGMAPMAGLSLEVWTTNGGILFDNFAISHSLNAAFAFADSTYSKKAEVDAKKKKDSDKEAKKKAKQDAKKDPKKDAKKGGKASKKDDKPKEPLEQALEIFDTIVESARENPWPMIATLLAAILALVLFSPPSKAPPAPVAVPTPVAAAAPVAAPAAAAAETASKSAEPAPVAGESK